jgi:DNA-binding MarR family transcriptional regulator
VFYENGGEKMSLERGIVELLRELSRYHKETLGRRMKCKGITPPQLMTLQQINKEPKTIGQIVNGLHLSYSTVSGIIDRLERDGWIHRERDEQDRRVIWIRKTEKMQAWVEGNSFFQETYYFEFLKGLSEEELSMLKKLNDLITTYMEKKVEENYEA